MTWEGWCAFSRGRLGLRKPDSAECVKVGQMESQERKVFVQGKAPEGVREWKAQHSGLLKPRQGGTPGVARREVAE